MNLRKVVFASLSAALICSCLNGGAASASQSGSAWPEMLGDNAHSSYSTDPSITSSSKFGIKWMTNLYNASMGSPAVAYNATLGKTVVYVGTQRADFFAIDAATGNILWSTNLGVNDKIEDTPLVAPDGSVWVGTAQNSTMYKLNGATGAIECSQKAPLPIDGSPMYAAPTGGAPSIYWGTIDTPTILGPVYGTNESNCATEWTFGSYRVPASAGIWVTPTFGVSKTGEPLVFFGTADSDSTEYAVDANTGSRVWDYAVANPNPYIYDIGDASTVSAPGNNGLADGAVYVDSKYGYEYALDMSTGLPYWQFEIAAGTSAQSSRSSAALDGTNLVFGYGGATGFGGGGGVYDLNAANGSQIWQYANPDSSEVLSSPAIVGPHGSEVVAFGDIAGQFQVLSLATGSSLYDYQTGGYITSSPAEADGTIFLAGSDGFLYAFGPNGNTAAAPSNAIGFPAENAKLKNPNGSITVTGTASDPTGVAAVSVAIEESGVAGPWYNAATGTYNPAPLSNPAVLASPGKTSTKWSLQLAVPPAGGTYEVFATAVNEKKIAAHNATVSFNVAHSGSEPNVTVSTTQIAPGATFTVGAKGFAAGESVQMAMFGKVLATAAASSTGVVPKTPITIPSSWQFGPTSLTLTGLTSGDTSSVTVNITNQWYAGGHDDDRTSEEPNDQVINKSLSVGNGTVLSQSWYYASTAAINSSPSIANGVAFFGNDTGTLSAVNVGTGAAKWTFTIPTGAAIQTAPAIDALQNVVVGAADGNVYVIGSQTGKLVRSIPVGGHPTSAVIDSGKTLVASDNGYLYAFSSTTGALAWKSALSGPSHSAPAYDKKTNIAVLGDNSGAVTAFNATTGAQLWKVTTGGAVTASPMIANSTVYVGSADGNMYAIGLTTGAVAWKYAATAPIVSPAALYGTGQIAVGDSKGQFYMLNPNGSLSFHINTQQGSPIVGISTVYANTFVTLANGTVGMIRTDGPVPFGWSFKTRSTLSTQVAIVDGTVYVGAADGGLYAFTPQGATPLMRTRGGATISITNGNDGWSCTQQPL